MKNLTYLNEFCPTNPPNPAVFNFGIFANAIDSRIICKTDFLRKFSRSFWWGLRNLRFVHIILNHIHMHNSAFLIENSQLIYSCSTSIVLFSLLMLCINSVFLFVVLLVKILTQVATYRRSCLQFLFLSWAYFYFYTSLEIFRFVLFILIHFLQAFITPVYKSQCIVIHQTLMCLFNLNDLN